MERGGAENAVPHASPGGPGKPADSWGRPGSPPEAKEGLADAAAAAARSAADRSGSGKEAAGCGDGAPGGCGRRREITSGELRSLVATCWCSSVLISCTHGVVTLLH